MVQQWRAFSDHHRDRKSPVCDNKGKIFQNDEKRLPSEQAWPVLGRKGSSREERADCWRTD
ncbi:MAG: hypothetical protein KatS3mg110_1076 [Pirellulaceae bacterium]|nr:MAG: hypothetical protein KatS3mg110_1076 [Pirellulaceae bacterium]